MAWRTHSATIDPVTGQQICTIAPELCRHCQALDSDRVRSMALDSAAHCRITVGDGSAGSGTLVSRRRHQPAWCSLARICSTMPRAESSSRFQTASDSRRGLSTAIERTTWPRSSIRRPELEPLAVSDERARRNSDGLRLRPERPIPLHPRQVSPGRPRPSAPQFPSLTIQGAVRPGDSGGGVLNARGQLVGVVWGQRDGLTYATCGRPVREFLERVFAAESHVAKQPPIANSPQSPAPSPHDRLARLVNRNRSAHPIARRQETRQRRLPATRRSQRLPAATNAIVPQIRCERNSPRHDRTGSTASSRFERARSKNIAASRVGFFEGLSFGKLLVGALGLSGPLAAAVIIAGGLAGRRIKKRGARDARSSEQKSDSQLLALSSPLTRPSPSIAHRRRNAPCRKRTTCRSKRIRSPKPTNGPANTSPANIPAPPKSSKPRTR